MKSLKFRQAERLRHRTLVNGLFSGGNTLYAYPLRLVWRVRTPDELSTLFRQDVPEDVGAIQMMVTVPKKNRRHAVDRVLMRRRIREAYRLNRLPLKEALSDSPEIGTLSIGFIYLAKENLPYDLIATKMTRLLDKLQAQICNRVTDTDDKQQ